MYDPLVIEHIRPSFSSVSLHCPVSASVAAGTEHSYHPSSVRIRRYFHRRLARTDAIVAALVAQTRSERRVIMLRRTPRSEIGSVGAARHSYTFCQYSRPLPTMLVLPLPRRTPKKINSWAARRRSQNGGTKSYEAAHPRTTIN